MRILGVLTLAGAWLFIALFAWSLCKAAARGDSLIDALLHGEDDEE